MTVYLLPKRTMRNYVFFVATIILIIHLIKTYC